MGSFTSAIDRNSVVADQTADFNGSFFSSTSKVGPDSAPAFSPIVLFIGRYNIPKSAANHRSIPCRSCNYELRVC